MAPGPLARGPPAGQDPEFQFAVTVPVADDDGGGASHGGIDSEQ
jgi:hypothetical protein